MPQSADLLGRLCHLQSGRHERARGKAMAADMDAALHHEQVVACRESARLLEGEGHPLLGEGLTREDLFGRLRLQAMGRAHLNEIQLEVESLESDIERCEAAAREQRDMSRLAIRRRDKLMQVVARIHRRKRRRDEAIDEMLSEEEYTCQTPGY